MLTTMPIRPSAFIICFEKQQQPKTVLEGRVRAPTVRSELQMMKADYWNVSCRNRWMILLINSKEVGKLAEKEVPFSKRLTTSVSLSGKAWCEGRGTKVGVVRYKRADVQTRANQIIKTSIRQDEA